MASNATAGRIVTVHSESGNDSNAQSITALANGGWLTTWVSYTGTTHMQRYDAQGAQSGDVISLTQSPSAAYQNAPCVAALSDGGWIVTFALGDGSAADIYQQRYLSDGRANGAPTLVNSTTANAQDYAQVTALGDGGWIVTWTSYNQVQNGGNDVVQQRFDEGGNKVGDERIVNTTTNGEQVAGDVTALLDGGWIVTWMDLSSRSIMQQRFGNDGEAIGQATHVTASGSASHQSGDVVALADGGWVVAWMTSDGSTYTRHFQRFDADGNAWDDPVRLDAKTGSATTAPVTAALADGGWVCAWVAEDGNTTTIYQQRFSADGRTVGTPTPVTEGVGHAYDPTITALPNGNWVLSWTSSSQDDESIVQQRVFAVDIAGGAGADTLRGTTWDEKLVGYAGDDILDGRAGTDTMVGGFGNDTYYVDNSRDVVQEMAGQGTDTIRSSVSYDLAKSGATENLALTGTASTTGIGNALANSITGNAANNKLYGMAGNDKLVGGAGNDTMAGGTGNDVYYVDSSRDVVQEASGQGTDKVISSVSYSIASLGNVEQLALSGSANINATGNALDNSITGNSGRNTLSGGAGNDTISGGSGNDVLLGGTGNDLLTGASGIDRFVFRNSEGKDRIKDFDATGSDHDVLDLSALSAISSYSDLRANHMHQSGSHVVIDINSGHSITLENVSMKNLDSGDFLF